MLSKMFRYVFQTKWRYSSSQSETLVCTKIRKLKLQYSKLLSLLIFHKVWSFTSLSCVVKYKYYTNRINIWSRFFRLEITQNGYSKNRGTNLFKHTAEKLSILKLFWSPQVGVHIENICTQSIFSYICTCNKLSTSIYSYIRSKSD